MGGVAPTALSSVPGTTLALFGEKQSDNNCGQEASVGPVLSGLGLDTKAVSAGQAGSHQSRSPVMAAMPGEVEQSGERLEQG